MNVKKIRIEGVYEKEIESLYQLAKSLLDTRNIQYREDKNLKTLWLPLHELRNEEVELFFTYGHITAYLWKDGQDFERRECLSIQEAFQYFNKRLERSRRNWK